MNKIKMVLLITALLFSCVKIYSQRNPEALNLNNIIEKKQKSFFLVHSIGYEFDSGKIPVYLSIKKIAGKKFTFGIKGGIIDNRINLVTGLYNGLLPFYNSHTEPGSYSVYKIPLIIKGLTWIASAEADYKLFNNLYVGAGIGFQSYRRTIYSTNFSYNRISESSPLIIDRVDYVNENPEIWYCFSLYYSAQVNYNYKSFLFGAYFDNLYSSGINLGISF